MIVIAAILGLQAALLVVGFAAVLTEVLGRGGDLGAAAVELAIIAIGVGWLVASGLGILRVRPWSRGSILAIEILHFAVAIGFFQGSMFANPAIGWAMLVPAVTAIVLLFTKPVIAATARQF